MGIRGGPRRDGVGLVARAAAGAGVVAALSCALAGCGGPEAGWGAEAEQYFADIHASWSSGFANLGTFFAPEAVIDTHTFTNRGPVPGRIAGVAILRENWDRGGPESSADEPPYLSTDGAIDPSRWVDDTFTVPQAPVYEFAGRRGPPG